MRLNVSPKRKASSQAGLPFMPWLGPYRHLAQFVFYPNCKHGSRLNLSYMQMQPMFCSKKTTRYPRISRALFLEFPNPREQSAHLNKKSRRKALAIVFELEGFGKTNLNKDGHLITEDSVLPTTAPGGAPEQNRCYQTPAYFIYSPPCARFARALGAPRTAHFATPPLGAGALVIALSCKPKLARIFP
jgi:hypothetical protein